MLKWYLKGTVAFIVRPVHSDLKTTHRKKKATPCAGIPRFISAWFTPNQTMCDLLRALKVTNQGWQSGAVGRRGHGRTVATRVRSEAACAVDWPRSRSQREVPKGGIGGAAHGVAGRQHARACVPPLPRYAS